MVDVTVRLKLSRYNLDREAHIKVDYAKCQDCPHRACLTACPAQCYVTQGTGVVFNYESCLECGTCLMICDQGAVDWEFPTGGCGINYRFS